MDNRDNSDIECENDEVNQLNQQITKLQHVLSQMRGEKLDGLSVKELEILEEKLETGLKRVRVEKDQHICDELHKLHKEGTKLMKEHAQLKRQLNQSNNKERNGAETSYYEDFNGKLQECLDEYTDSNTSLNLGS